MQAPETTIMVSNLTRRFGSFTAVDGISFTVGKGEIFGLLGANGAGKTTTIRMLTGLLKPTSGEAYVAGMDIYRHANRIKQRIGYMSQRFTLYRDLTVWENIRFYGGIYGLPRKTWQARGAQLLTTLSLDRHAGRKVGTLPPGWRQKLAFSIALMHNPEIVFLDEPTSGVDPLTRRQFWENIYHTAAGGTTMIVTTHYLEEAEYCTRVAIMVDGRLVECDAPAALKAKYRKQSMQDVFIAVVRTKTTPAR